jgi:hypothetical protein
VVVDGERLLRRVVANLEPRERWIRREDAFEAEAEVARKQQLVVPAPERVSPGRARNGPVEPVARDHDEVCSVERREQVPPLLLVLLVVEPQLEALVEARRVAPDAERQAVVPMLVRDDTARLDVLVDPP